MDALFIHRIHEGKNANIVLPCLKRLARQIREFAPSHKLVSIVDNSSAEFAAKVEDTAGGAIDELRIENSKTQEGKLASGAPCSIQYHNVYVSVPKAIKRHADPSTVVFFIEDDYLFKDDAFEKGYRFARAHPQDFVGLFDHPDRYRPPCRELELDFRENHIINKTVYNVPIGYRGADQTKTYQGYMNYRLELIWDSGHHWRTCVSTCHTFLCAYKALELNDRYLLNVDVERDDHAMWTQIWGEGKSKLWGAVPGLARHMGHNPPDVLLDDGPWMFDPS